MALKEVGVGGVPRRRRGLILALGALLALGGCQTFAPGSGGTVAVGGTYRGYLWVEGSPALTGLTLVPRGSRLDASLDSEVGVSGTGEGNLSGDGLRVEIPYRTTCPGRIRLDGRVSPDGARYEGEFEAADCTGSTSGRFEFRRP